MCAVRTWLGRAREKAPFCKGVECFRHLEWAVIQGIHGQVVVG
jgi:hypothetical protein